MKFIRSSAKHLLSAALTSTALLAAPADPAQAVKRELNADGQLFAYIDFEGGWKKVAQDVQAALKDTAVAKKDFVALADATGLAQIRALGLSSTLLKDGYDNRLFIYTPGGRKGLLAIFPGEPAAFDGARLAPADADFFLELRLDVPAVMGAITEIAASVADSKEMAQMAIDLMRKDPKGYGSLLDFKGRIVAAFRLHSPAEVERAKAEFSSKLPMDLFLQSAGGGAIVKAELAASEDWKREEQGGRIRFTKTNNDVEILVVVEGESVTAGFPKAFVEECLVRKDGLAQNPAFKQALADTAPKGHSLIYMTPRTINELRNLVGSLSEFARNPFFEGHKQVLMLNQLLSAIPVPTKPVASVMVARPDGLLLRERSVQSLKVSLPGVALLTPDFLGQILRAAAQAYAASTEVERAGEIIHQKISGDLSAVRIAAMKYFDAHPEEGEVRLTQLRETMPEEKIPELADVQGDITFSRASDQITFDLKNGHSITHVFPLTPEQKKTIEGTLKQLAEASAEYLLAGNSYVSVSRLVDSGYIAKPEVFAGEDYDSISYELEVATLTVKTPGEQEVSYARDPGFLLQARRRQAERQIAIEKNLARIHAAARKFLEENTDASSVSFEQLAEKGLVSDIQAVAGENYANEFSNLTKDDAKLSINAPRAGNVTWVRPLDEAVRKELTQRLVELERAAAQYFAKNPKAEVVISGELIPQPAVKAAKPVEADTDENVEPKQPDLNALVIRSDYTSLKLELENDQVIEVSRTKAK